MANGAPDHDDTTQPTQQHQQNGAPTTQGKPPGNPTPTPQPPVPHSAGQYPQAQPPTAGQPAVTVTTPRPQQGAFTRAVDISHCQYCQDIGQISSCDFHQLFMNKQERYIRCSNCVRDGRSRCYPWYPGTNQHAASQQQFGGQQPQQPFGAQQQLGAPQQFGAQQQVSSGQQHFGTPQQFGGQQHLEDVPRLVHDAFFHVLTELQARMPEEYKAHMKYHVDVGRLAKKMFDSFDHFHEFWETSAEQMAKLTQEATEWPAEQSAAIEKTLEGLRKEILQQRSSKQVQTMIAKYVEDHLVQQMEQQVGNYKSKYQGLIDGWQKVSDDQQAVNKRQQTALDRYEKVVGELELLKGNNSSFFTKQNEAMHKIAQFEKRDIENQERIAGYQAQIEQQTQENARLRQQFTAMQQQFTMLQQQLQQPVQQPPQQPSQQPQQQPQQPQQQTAQPQSQPLNAHPQPNSSLEELQTKVDEIKDRLEIHSSSIITLTTVLQGHGGVFHKIKDRFRWMGRHSKMFKTISPCPSEPEYWRDEAEEE